MAVDFSPLQTSANEARSASTLAQNLKAIKKNKDGSTTVTITAR